VDLGEFPTRLAFPGTVCRRHFTRSRSLRITAATQIGPPGDTPWLCLFRPLRTKQRLMEKLAIRLVILTGHPCASRLPVVRIQTEPITIKNHSSQIVFMSTRLRIFS